MITYYTTFFFCFGLQFPTIRSFHKYSLSLYLKKTAYPHYIYIYLHSPLFRYGHDTIHTYPPLKLKFLYTIPLFFPFFLMLRKIYISSNNRVSPVTLTHSVIYGVQIDLSYAVMEKKNLLTLEG